MVAICEDVLGLTHTDTLKTVEVLTTAVAFGGSMEDAERIALEWHARVEDAVGPTHRSTGRLAMLVYNVYDSWGKTALMPQWLERARASDHPIGPEHGVPADETDSSG